MERKILIYCLVISLWGTVVYGTSKLSLHPLRVITGEDCTPWAKIECWQDKSPHFREEKFLLTTDHLKYSIFGKGIYEAFGTTTPHSSFFLLHYGKDWDIPPDGNLDS